MDAHLPGYTIVGGVSNCRLFEPSSPSKFAIVELDSS